MPTMHPALWRGCQIIKRSYEIVLALAKLIFKLWKRNLDTLKQAFILPLSRAQGPGHCFSLLMPSPFPYIAPLLIPSFILPSTLSPQRSPLHLGREIFLCVSPIFMAMIGSKVTHTHPGPQLSSLHPQYLWGDTSVSDFYPQGPSQIQPSRQGMGLWGGRDSGPSPSACSQQSGLPNTHP